MSVLVDYFQRIYVINLPTRTDRKQQMMAQLKSIGLPMEHPKVALFPAVRPHDAGGFPSIGARGCFLSHLSILKSAYCEGLHRFLVFEDDLNFVSGFKQRIPSVIDSLSSRRWSLFYGGYHLNELPEYRGQSEVVTILAEHQIRTTHFIAFQQPAIDQLVPFLDAVLSRAPGDKLGGPMHVDGAYNWYRRLHPEEVTLAAVPVLGYQRRSRTDVHDLRWFDRAPGVRALVEFMRRGRLKTNAWRT